MQSLLGQFYSRIRGSQENIASEGLVYILERSDAARLSLVNIIRNKCNLAFPDLKFDAQSTGTNFERPDIVGQDDIGNKLLIIEAKFWAALTDNQPETYLTSLSDNSALLFVCPDLRIRPVFNEIRKRLDTAGIQAKEAGEWHLVIPRQNKHLMVMKWEQVLEPIRNTLYQEKETELLADITQIIGFCNTIDNTAFLPIQSEDLSPKFARRINSYFDVVDNVVEELKKLKKIDTKRLRSVGLKYAYLRYFRMNQLGVSFHLRFDLWAKVADTPFWVLFKDDLTSGEYWIMTDGFKNKVRDVARKFGYAIYKDYYKDLYMGLPPAIDLTGDEVIKDFANKIIALNDELSKG